MTDSLPRISTWNASDGYPIHLASWIPTGKPRSRVVVLHGVQSHGGWYHNLGRTLAEAGYEAHFPDRRGSGANRIDRGHTPSMGRLLDDVAEFLASLKAGVSEFSGDAMSSAPHPSPPPQGGRESDASGRLSSPGPLPPGGGGLGWGGRVEPPETAVTPLKAAEPPIPTALAGISWGGKLAVITAGRRPDLVDALALICPGLHPRVDVSRLDRLRIALAYFIEPRKTFPIPLSDPALFTDSHAGQEFIANDPLGLRAATARLLAASSFIDRVVRRIPPRVHQPCLLMVAGRDRIVDNAKTLKYFEKLASKRREVIEYPEGHHTFEFDADPSEYARDLVAWLDRALIPK